MTRWDEATGLRCDRSSVFKPSLKKIIRHVFVAAMARWVNLLGNQHEATGTRCFPGSALWQDGRHKLQIMEKARYALVLYRTSQCEEKCRWFVLRTKSLCQGKPQRPHRLRPCLCRGDESNQAQESGMSLVLAVQILRGKRYAQGSVLLQTPLVVLVGKAGGSSPATALNPLEF